ncbi:MAG: orotidine-5'-phosphate decarboxylase [bacterium]
MHSNKSHAFNTRFREIVSARRSLLCVGLDPELTKLPASLPRNADGVALFCQEIISATAPFAAAFKVNFAFFEALGKTGWAALERVARALPADTIRLADAKRGDIGNTARLYAHAIFRELPFDALTANPYLGEDAALPFLEDPSKGVFFLCRTSNPGSAGVQLFPHRPDVDENEPLYLHIARTVAEWNQNDNAGLVVGATHLHELERVRQLCPSLPFLIPGVGAQGGDLEAAMKSGTGSSEDLAILNVSRAIIYAGHEKNFGEAAAQEAESLCRQMRELRKH